MIAWFKQLFGLGEQKKSSAIAKERLMVIVAHERGSHENQPDFLPLLQKEITEVIAKYVKIDEEQVQAEFEQKGGRSVLELNVTLPQHEIRKALAEGDLTPAASPSREKTGGAKTRKTPAKSKV